MLVIRPSLEVLPKQVLRGWRKGALLHCWRKSKLGQPLWKKVWRFLRKLEIELPYDAAIPRLGIYPKELQAGSQTESYTPTFIATLYTIAKTWKQR